MNQQPQNASVLTKIRTFFWPIFGKEHFKFIPLTLMVSLILFDYTILRNMKDALIVTTSGSEQTTFLKLCVVLPAAIALFFVISKLANVVSRQTLFYSLISFFLIFFGVFAWVLYPNLEVIHPIAYCDDLAAKLPQGFSYLINTFKYWSFSLLYVMAELWGSAISAFLFWQFANSIVKISEAKRFYGHFYLLANIATASSGLVSRYFSKVNSVIPDPTAAYGATLSNLMSTIIIAGVVVMIIYYLMDKFIVTNPEFVDPKEVKPAKKKLKLSMVESIKFILSSKYLGLIALLVISYGISINLVEVAWKNQVGLLFPNKNDYQAYMGAFTFISGLSTFVVILVGGYFLRILGWRMGALATPILIGITGALFYIGMIFSDLVEPLVTILGTSALFFTVTSGSIQNVLSKSTKYALFDPTKEMAYIPLDDESKLKGKAAVDVVGGRLGKAGGGFIQQFLFIFIGPLSVVAPICAIIMGIIVLIWIFSVYKLNILFREAGGYQQWNK